MPFRAWFLLLAAVGLAAAPAQAPPTFTEIATGPSDIRAHEVNWGDYDNDGDLDIGLLGFLTSDGSRAARIYRNDAGTFTHDAVPALFPYTEGPFIFGDYDRDGDLDVMIGGWSGGTGSRIYRNEGGGPFTWLDNGLRGMKGADAAWADFDNDGDLDLLLAGESYDTGMADYALIYRNDGAGVFTESQSLAGLYLGSVSAGDYDRDGDLDIAICGRTAGARVYRNTNGVFADIGATLPSVIGGMIAWGDFDNDGDLDLALGGREGATPLLRIYRNDAGTFVDHAAGLPGVFGGRASWGDYDNDGDPDLLVNGENAVGAAVTIIYRNTAGVFADAGLGLVGTSNQCSSAFGDFDNDGDLDLVYGGETTPNVASTSVTKLYRNNSAVANTPPSAPAVTTSVAVGNDVTFLWSASSDPQTPVSGLTYNLRVGTTTGGQEVMAAMSHLTTGLRRLPAPGNAQQNLSWTLRDLPDGTYYFAVQAVDGGFLGSAWSAEQSIVLPVVGPPVTIVDLIIGSCGLLGVEVLVIPILLLIRRRRMAKSALLALAWMALGTGALVAQEVKPKDVPTPIEKPQEPPPQDKKPPESTPTEKKPQEVPPPQDKPQEVPPPPQEPAPPPPVANEGTDGFWASARVGAWFTPEFQATTALGLRRIDGGAKGSGGVDLDYRTGLWFLRLSFDYAGADDVSLWTVGGHVGVQVPLLESEEFPVWATVSAGAIGGGLEVGVGAFGSFDPGMGFQARAELSSRFGPGIHVSLWVDYRILRYEYQTAVLSGDTSAGGSSVAVGGALSLRF